jgi:hypothetical protein
MSSGNAEVVILAKDATLRDMFAAKAMQGIIRESLSRQVPDFPEKSAEWAYKYADAMLKERTNVQP